MIAAAFIIYRVLSPTPLDPVTLAEKAAASERSGLSWSDSLNQLKNGVLIDEPRLLKMGATTDEIKGLGSFDLAAANRSKKRFAAFLATYEREKNWPTAPFFSQGPPPCYKFPAQVIWGAIAFGAGPPILARGKVAVVDGEKRHFYMSWVARSHAELLHKFGAGEISSLDVAVSRPSDVIKIVQNWSNLKELFFFNSLLKAAPACENYDESALTDSDLPAIDKMQNLESLGLCGPNISGAAVLNLDILKKIKKLAIKRVAQVGDLIEALPSLDNLEELTLIDEGTTDEQLDCLSNMKNLTALSVLRSEITPASVKYFKQMSKLQKLTIDKNNWSTVEKATFVSQLKGCSCQFTPVLDGTYWPSEPASTRSQPVPGLPTEVE